MTKPEYPASTGTEREILEAHLEHNRRTVRHKIEGISKELGVKRLGPTATSMLGVLKHLTEVEYWWFQDRLTGIDFVGGSSQENPDGEFEVQDTENVESLLAEYDRACATAREICKKYKLEDEAFHVRKRDNKKPTLRWIYIHMIEEIARHNGHLDIYRELLDGVNDSA